MSIPVLWSEKSYWNIPRDESIVDGTDGHDPYYVELFKILYAPNIVSNKLEKLKSLHLLPDYKVSLFCV